MIPVEFVLILVLMELKIFIGKTNVQMEFTLWL